MSTLRAAMCLLAALSAWGGGVGAAAAAEPGFYRAAAEVEAPLPVRWLGVGERDVLISDRTTGVGAVRLDSGVVAWIRSLDGGARPLWASGDLLIVVGDKITAYNRTIGTVAWERRLSCDQGRCAERVVHVDDTGVYLAGGGVVQTAVQRLELASGAPLWTRPAAVDHPRASLAGQGWLAFQEANPPFAVHFVGVADGATRGRWVRRVAGIPRPVSDLLLDSQGRPAAVDLRPGGELRAQAWLLDADGHELAAVEAPPAPGVSTFPVWTALRGDRLWTWAPRPSADDGLLSAYDLAGHEPPRTLDVGGAAAPTRFDDVAVFHRVVGETVVASAVDLRSAAPSWSHTFGGDLGGRVTLFSAGGLAVFAGHGELATLWVVAAKTGEILGYRALDLGDAEVTAVASDDGRTLYVGAGRKVMQLVLAPVSRASALFEAHIAAGRVDDARALVAALAPMASVSPTVRRLQSAATGARLSVIREAFASSRAAGFDVLAGAVAGATEAAELVALLSPAGRLVAEHAVAGGRRLGGRDVDALAGLAARVAAQLERHRAAFAQGGPLWPRQAEVRAAAVVIGWALDLNRQPLAAADVVATVSGPGFSTADGTGDVYRVFALTALDELRKESAAALRRGRPSDLEALSKALRLFRHGEAALLDGAYLASQAMAIADPDASFAKASAKALAKDLSRRVSDRRAEIGRGYGLTGCVRACGAAGAVCVGGCHLELDCREAADRCMQGCERRGQPSWRPRRCAR